MNVGILGGGQLGRMLALAGLPFGMHFTFLEPADAACAADVGHQIKRAYDDPDGLTELCELSDVVTYEFENVPVHVAQSIQARRSIFPPPEALRVAQDRFIEKSTFKELDIDVTPFAAVSSLPELTAAVGTIGLPAILKTRRMGYDGKGQFMIRTAADIDNAWSTLGPNDFILEAFVPFKREISCLGVRSRTGEMAFYPVAENQHRAGILRISTPRANDPLQAQAETFTQRMLERLDYVGTLGFEFFDLGDGRLLGNEIAPRVHNSGHWSIEGSRCSQFENHMRAVAGLKLGDTSLRGPCAMVNFISTAPSAAELSGMPGVHPHLYGKSPRPRRKIGHATVTANDSAMLQQRVDRLVALLPKQD
ncbi:MAG: 5-(carboxyamino)imidazole ribonucleotide synthase [Nevskiaceae bacterium]|nr:MAG: 5-(carboxyamino)imidazole ribonucleotide synthase [Nevskiaceae bacterium]TBR72501.1 MAG: 5-(carboxyamino)imidazole ribonucleotide synthase [Nevskiaceae bacterium]